MAFLYTFLYQSTVEDYGNWDHVVEQSWPIVFSVMVGNISVSLVQVRLVSLPSQSNHLTKINFAQGFLSFRLYRLCRKWWLTVIPSVGILLRLSCSTSASVVANNDGTGGLFVLGRMWWFILGQTAGAVVDVFLAVSLCVFLWTNRTQFQR